MYIYSIFISLHFYIEFILPSFEHLFLLLFHFFKRRHETLILTKTVISSYISVRILKEQMDQLAILPTEVSAETSRIQMKLLDASQLLAAAKSHVLSSYDHDTTDCHPVMHEVCVFSIQLVLKYVFFLSNLFWSMCFSIQLVLKYVFFSIQHVLKYPTYFEVGVFSIQHVLKYVFFLSNLFWSDAKTIVILSGCCNVWMEYYMRHN